MTLSAIEYFLFLSGVFLLFWLVFSKTKTLQNSLIIAAGLFFYRVWDWHFLGLLLIPAFTFFFESLFRKISEKKKEEGCIIADHCC